MDTRENKLVHLSEQELTEAQQRWGLWQAGVLPEMPRYAPVTNEIAPRRPARKRVKSKATKSYKSFCNG